MENDLLLPRMRLGAVLRNTHLGASFRRGLPDIMDPHVLLLFVSEHSKRSPFNLWSKPEVLSPKP